MARFLKIDFKPAAKKQLRHLIKALEKPEALLNGPKTQETLKHVAEQGLDFLLAGIQRRRSGWSELSAITKAIKGNDRPLVDTGTFIRAMKAWNEGKAWFAGLPEGATGPGGEDLAVIGAVHEHGATIPVSPEMRAFFAFKGFPLRTDTRFIVVPPRPWFGPAAEETEKYAAKVLPALGDILARELK